MQPLDRIASFRKIAEMFGSAREIIVAAPYFGEGAAEQLGFVDTEAKVTVLCDLFSGGCNPREIDRIRKVKARPTVRRLAGLHAKIYLTESDVVIGSANPSANGLGFEGKELVGNIEGCVHSNDPVAVAAWRSFFEEAINRRATDVNDADIDRAIPLFVKNRKERTRSDVGTLLAEMRSNREQFKDRDIFFCLYKRKKTTAIQAASLTEERIARGSENFDAYFDWADPKPEPGTYIIDFSYGSGQKVSYGGIWRVVEKDHVVPLGEGNKIVIFKTSDIQGLRIPKADQAFFCQVLQEGLSEHPEVYVSAYQAKIGQNTIASDSFETVGISD